MYQDRLQETFAFSFQQIIRVMKYHEASFSEAEKEVVDRIIDYNLAKEKYDFYLVDGVKDTFRPQANTQDLLNFYRLWFKKLIEFPMDYIHSIIGTCGGLFSSTHKININTEFNDWGNLGVTMLKNGFNTKFQEVFLQVYRWISDVPIINVIFQTYFYSWILGCFLFWKSIYKRNKKLLLVCLPIFFSVVTLILSPKVDARYALQLIMIAPLMFSLNVNVFSKDISS